MTERILHCWADESDQYEWGSDEYWAHWPSGTCYLLDGHEGPHEFTPDDQVMITFADDETEEKDERLAVD